MKKVITYFFLKSNETLQHQFEEDALCILRDISRNVSVASRKPAPNVRRHAGSTLSLHIAIENESNFVIFFWKSANGGVSIVEKLLLKDEAKISSF